MALGDAMIRVGLVGASPGCGWCSGVYRRVLERLPEFVLQAVCTTREEGARAAAACPCQPPYPAGVPS